MTEYHTFILKARKPFIVFYDTDGKLRFNLLKVLEKGNIVLNQTQCLGLADDHIDFDSVVVPLHKKVVTHYEALVSAAEHAGFALRAVSGYRSFSRQVEIWNDKIMGRRPVLDANELPVDIAALSERELIFTILRWSALPGSSRHHWGSDFDIYDAKALGDKPLELTVAETKEGGPFCAMYAWLDDYLEQHADIYSRPYKEDCGGVAPEPWHISCVPVARSAERLFDKTVLRDTIASSDLMLKHSVIEHLDEIIERFVIVAKNS